MMAQRDRDTARDYTMVLIGIYWIVVDNYENNQRDSLNSINKSSFLIVFSHHEHHHFISFRVRNLFHNEDYINENGTWNLCGT